VTLLRFAMMSLAFGLAASTALADGDYMSPTNERIRLSLGVMRITTATSLRVDSTGGTVGAYLNGENDLGLDTRRYEPKFEFMVRAGERNRLFVDYFMLDRTDTKILAQGPDTFGNVVLLVGDPVLTNLNIRIFGLTYGYSLWHGEKLEISALFGLNDADISARLRVQTPTRHIDDSQDLAGPFPTPGLTATYVASQRFYFDASAKYFKLSADRLSGSVGMYDVDVYYRLRQNISFALGYNAVKAILNSAQPRTSGSFDFSAKGPELFVRVAF
jgi:hypothetical protein